MLQAAGTGSGFAGKLRKALCPQAAPPLHVQAQQVLITPQPVTGGQSRDLNWRSALANVPRLGQCPKRSTEELEVPVCWESGGKEVPIASGKEESVQGREPGWSQQRG